MSYLAKGLQIFGALALVALVAVAGYVAYLYVSNSDRTDSATNDGVKFVLNWGGLDANQGYKVLHSFESQRSLTGDHLDHYCIQIADFSPAIEERENWTPLAGLDGWAKEAASRAYASGDAPECFERALAESPELQAYVWSVTAHGRNVEAYDIILFDAQTKRLLYVSDKT